MAKDITLLKQMADDVIAGVYQQALTAKKEHTELQFGKLKETYLIKFLHEIIKNELPNVKLEGVEIEAIYQKLLDVDFDTVKVSDNGEKGSMDKEPKRLPHNKQEDKEILEFAIVQATDGFFEEELVKHLEAKIGAVKVLTLRNKLNRFSRSPKNFLQKSSARQKFYSITKKGTKELMVLRKRAEQLD